MNTKIFLFLGFSRSGITNKRNKRKYLITKLKEMRDEIEEKAKEREIDTIIKLFFLTGPKHLP